jgi:hypothetical protein
MDIERVSHRYFASPSHHNEQDLPTSVVSSIKAKDVAPLVQFLQLPW